jgi:hypothetical protein
VSDFELQRITGTYKPFRIIFNAPGIPRPPKLSTDAPKPYLVHVVHYSECLALKLAKEQGKEPNEIPHAFEGPGMFVGYARLFIYILGEDWVMDDEYPRTMQDMGLNDQGESMS